jgi:hypothetical protein
VRVGVKRSVIVREEQKNEARWSRPSRKKERKRQEQWLEPRTSSTYPRKVRREGTLLSAFDVNHSLVPHITRVTWHVTSQPL